MSTEPLKPLGEVRVPDGPPAERAPMTLPRLAEMKRQGEPIVMVTAYDYPSARVAELAGVDLVLIGDSAANTVLGYETTVPVSMDEMIMLAGAVRRGLRTPLLVGDLPFLSYQVTDQQAIESAGRFVKEAGCAAVKVEGAGDVLGRVRAIAGAGIPVMGHVGLTPQTATMLGGYRAQGRTAERAAQVARDAVALQEAGCFGLVFEAIPAEVADEIMKRLKIPVIGIGAGPGTDGQVLVFHDILGIREGAAPRFAKQYADAGRLMVEGVRAFADEVRQRRFPDAEHSYSIDPGELEGFRSLLANVSTWDALG